MIKTYLFFVGFVFSSFALAQSPAQTLAKKGRDACNKKKFQSGISDLEAANALDPKQPYFLDIGDCYLAWTGNNDAPKKALESYQKALSKYVKTDPQYATILSDVNKNIKKKADTYFAEGKNQNAIELYDVAYQWNSHPGYLVNIAFCYAASKNSAKSVDFYQQFLQVNDSYYTANPNATQQANLKNAAQKGLSEILKETTDTAKKELSSGGYQKAIESFELAYKIDTNPEYLLQIIDCFIKLGDDQESLARVERLLSVSTNATIITSANEKKKEIAKLLRSRAESLLQKEQYQDAIIELEKSYQIDKDVDCLYEQGEIYQKIGDKENALKKLEQFINTTTQQHPKYETAKQKREELQPTSKVTPEITPETATKTPLNPEITTPTEPTADKGNKTKRAKLLKGVGISSLGLGGISLALWMRAFVLVGQIPGGEGVDGAVLKMSDAQENAVNAALKAKFGTNESALVCSAEFENDVSTALAGVAGEDPNVPLKELKRRCSGEVAGIPGLILLGSGIGSLAIGLRTEKKALQRAVVLPSVGSQSVGATLSISW